MRKSIIQYQASLYLGISMMGFVTLIGACQQGGMTTEPIEPDVEIVDTIKIETLHSNFPANGAVSIDENGDVYISEYGVYEGTGGNGTRIFKMTSEGEILDTLTDLSGPMGTKKDSQGNLYINNDNNTERGIILKVMPDGSRSDFATIPGWPSSMAMDADDNIYVSNYSAPTVHKITPEGVVSEYARDERLNGGVGIDFDSNGNLVLGNFFSAMIVSISPLGDVNEIVTIPNVVVQGWGLGYLTIIEDKIYTTGIAVSKVYQVELDGRVSVFAGDGQARVVDGPLLEASISNPNGIGSDKKNNILYISEYGPNGGIRKIQL